MDERLSSLLATELEQYRAATSARRGSQSELRSVSHIDDYPPYAVRDYVKNARANGNALDLEDWASEILLGDPLMDLN